MIIMYYIFEPQFDLKVAFALNLRESNLLHLQKMKL